MHIARGTYTLSDRSPNGSTLFQILKDCTPKGIFKYISNAKDTPTHHYKTLVLNLACGASINQVRVRDEFLVG